MHIKHLNGVQFIDLRETNHESSSAQILISQNKKEIRLCLQMVF